MLSPDDGAKNERYSLVQTALGVCGVAWNRAGLTCVHLPERTAAATESRLRHRPATRADNSLPDLIEHTIAALQRYCAGTREHFADIPLDMSMLTAFDRAVNGALRDVAWGRTTTYGTLAVSVGLPDAARAVGVAMSRNAWPIIIPCHRVLAANGAMGGFSAYGGALTKQKLLALEGNGGDMLPLFMQEPEQ